ncbi:hypothetical protein WIS52_00650 [Pseudonocardia nematodicida]|uniref:Uncharacterized protein n=1 Tax=Pseudonocardia nematodicida TaxID=1206997 RepID=A0ABV1K5T6_9PSEU
MHTADILRARDFPVRRDGAEAGLGDVFPGFTAADRLGIVAAGPGDTLLAAPLLLAAVGAFYDDLHAAGTDFYRYPDFFVLHVGRRHGYHNRLDIWPQSKEVVVAEDPQEILAAINDRGITRLILPDVAPAGGVVMRHAAELAGERLRSIVVATAEPAPGAWTVEPSVAAVPLIAGCAEISADRLGADRARSLAAAAGSGRHYRPVDTDTALSVLCGLGATDEFFGFDAEYRAATGIGEPVLARDRYLLVPPVDGRDTATGRAARP